MLKSYLLFFYIICTFLPVANAQGNEILLFIDSNTVIGRISNNDVFISENEIGYTIQGNIIFNGTSMLANDILFIINAKDVLGKKAGIIYQNDSKTVQYITQYGSFFFGDYPIDKQTETLLYLVQQDESTLVVYDGLNNSNLGHISGTGFNSPRLAIAAHLYIVHYGLDLAAGRLIDSLNSIENQFMGGLIRPVYSDNAYFDWIWDGKTLKPVSGNRPEDEWKFDGRYLKPVWNLDPRSEWIWENNILKPFWDNNVELQWIWEENTLRPFWAPNPDRIWVLEEEIIRPMWNYDQNIQWKIEGEVPLAIVAMVVLGFADRP